MAMHQPGSRVVGRVGDNKPTISGQMVDVTARRVSELQAVEVHINVELAQAGT